MGGPNLAVQPGVLSPVCKPKTIQKVSTTFVLELELVGLCLALVLDSEVMPALLKVQQSSVRSLSCWVLGEKISRGSRKHEDLILDEIEHDRSHCQPD